MRTEGPSLSLEIWLIIYLNRDVGAGLRREGVEISRRETFLH